MRLMTLLLFALLLVTVLARLKLGIRRPKIRFKKPNLRGWAEKGKKFHHWQKTNLRPFGRLQDAVNKGTMVVDTINSAKQAIDTLQDIFGLRTQEDSGQPVPEDSGQPVPDNSVPENGENIQFRRESDTGEETDMENILEE